MKKAVYVAGRLVMYLLLLDMAVVFLYPFLYMAVTSFKSYNDVYNATVKWLPMEFSPGNWVYAFKALNYGTSFTNSLIVTVLATAGHIFSGALVGYGFARFRFPLNNALFMVVIFTVIVPVQTIITPLYMIYSKLGMVGSYLPMVLPTYLGMGLKGGLFIFLYRQYFIKLPRALEEAAYIDGCGRFKTFLRIAWPSAGSTTLVCAVLSIVWHWHDYFEPNIYLTDYKKMLLPQMLPQMYNYLEMLSNAATEEALTLKMVFHTGVVMAGTALATLPLLVMYFILQRWFMQGIERTGLVE